MPIGSKEYIGGLEMKIKSEKQRCGINIFITFISRLLIFYLPT
jgi:hypothetical protein